MSVPVSTGYMDLAKAFSTGQVNNNDGCLEGSLDANIDSGGATNTVTFGTQFVGNNEYIVIMIKADASFTGHISEISIPSTWS